jgi:hypothetical protein
VGEFEFSRLAAGLGSGKGAFLVSEQFRFDEISSKIASLFFSNVASGGCRIPFFIQWYDHLSIKVFLKFTA